MPRQYIRSVFSSLPERTENLRLSCCISICILQNRSARNDRASFSWHDTLLNVCIYVPRRIINTFKISIYELGNWKRKKKNSESPIPKLFIFFYFLFWYLVINASHDCITYIKFNFTDRKFLDCYIKIAQRTVTIISRQYIL